MIKIDTDMPECCGCCPFLGDTLGRLKGKNIKQYVYCGLLGTLLSIEKLDKKHKNCPLIEVKTDDKT